MTGTSIDLGQGLSTQSDKRLLNRGTHPVHVIQCGVGWPRQVKKGYAVGDRSTVELSGVFDAGVRRRHGRPSNQSMPVKA